MPRPFRASDVSDHVLQALIVVQPFILLVAGIGAGVALGERVALRSWLTARLRGDLPPSMHVSGLTRAACGRRNRRGCRRARQSVCALDRVTLGCEPSGHRHGDHGDQLRWDYRGAHPSIWTSEVPCLGRRKSIDDAPACALPRRRVPFRHPVRSGSPASEGSAHASDSDCDFAYCSAQCITRFGFRLAVLATRHRTRDARSCCHAHFISGSCHRALGSPRSAPSLRSICFRQVAALSARNCDGVCPVKRRNSVLKLDLLTKPASNITSMIESSVSRRARCA